MLPCRGRMSIDDRLHVDDFQKARNLYMWHIYIFASFILRKWNSFSFLPWWVLTTFIRDASARFIYSKSYRRLRQISVPLLASPKVHIPCGSRNRPTNIYHLRSQIHEIVRRTWTALFEFQYFWVHCETFRAPDMNNTFFWSYNTFDWILSRGFWHILVI